MSDRTELSIILVTYNSHAFVGDCLRSVAATVRCRHEIVVADNASSDGTVDLLRRSFPEVTVIEMGENAGFARANNRALAASVGRHAVLLNGDTLLGEGALDALVAFLDENAGAGVASPQLLNTDLSDQRTARSFPTPAAALWGRRSPLTRWFPKNRWSTRYLIGADPVSQEPYEVDWVSGACLMAPRHVLEQVGGLDEGFFMHWEDADWCRRVKDAGFGVYCVPRARVIHAEGGSRRGWPPAQVRHFHRGAYRYYAKHHLNGPRRLLRPLAAAALAGRAGFVITRDVTAERLRRRHRSRVVPSGAACNPT